MTLEEALKYNPYDPNKGSKAAYCRYLRYNVRGYYRLPSSSVRILWEEEEEEQRKIEEMLEFARLPASEQRKQLEDMGKAFAKGFEEGLEEK